MQDGHIYDRKQWDTTIGVTHANIGHSILNLNIVFEILNFMLYLDAEQGVYCKSV